MSGHVFVIQGSLEHLDYDAVVVSTDDRFSVTGRWREVLGTTLDTTGHCVVDTLQPKDWTNKGYGRAVETTEGITPPRPTWFVDSARYQDQTPKEAVDKLMTRLAATLQQIAAAGLPSGNGRPHLLVALPTLGTGGGGFGPIRGAVIDALLTTCQEAVAHVSFDVVIVAKKPSDYTAFQARRRQLPHHEVHLGSELRKTAEELARIARQGELALFLGAGVGIPAGLPNWKTLLEGLAKTLNVKIDELDSDLDKATAALSGELAKQQEEGTQYTLRPVRSAERRLLHTCLFYAEERAHRCWTVSGLSKGPWMESDFIRERPRALVFLDIAPGTPIVPMAAELDEGEVKTFYDRLNQEAVVWGETAPPKWPDENDGSAAATYWDWYQQNAHTSKVAMRLMERVIGDGGRPSWVDYRGPVWGSDGRAVTSLHLHVQGGEEYTTGDFAHRLVHRGRKHGLRVVGLLKEGPALNVLAVYER